MCEHVFGTLDEVDATAADLEGRPAFDWGLPVEIPARVLADLLGVADTHAVVVRNGVVLHAPGRLDLGRTTRLANRAQRRALRALYPTCALPGCTARFDTLTVVRPDGTRQTTGPPGRRVAA